MEERKREGGEEGGKGRREGERPWGERRGRRRWTEREVVLDGSLFMTRTQRYHHHITFAKLLEVSQEGSPTLSVAALHRDVNSRSQSPGTILETGYNRCGQAWGWVSLSMVMNVVIFCKCSGFSCIRNTEFWLFAALQ